MTPVVFWFMVEGDKVPAQGIILDVPFERAELDQPTLLSLTQAVMARPEYPMRGYEQIAQAIPVPTQAAATVPRDRWLSVEEFRPHHYQMIREQFGQQAADEYFREVGAIAS